jgi:hypothetical protein
MAKIIGAKKDDTEVRNAVIKIYKDFFNILLEGTPQKENRIDLIGIDNPKFRVEVEHGQWNGNFWDDYHYSTLSRLGFPTVNVPIRKEKHYLPEYYFYGKYVDNSESYLLNQYVRTNKDFSQFILIESDTFRDSEKRIYATFKAGNSIDVEKWMCFRREHVKTYNLINGVWVLEEVIKPIELETI